MRMCTLLQQVVMSETCCPVLWQRFAEEELPLEKYPNRQPLLTIARIHDGDLIADEEDRLSRWSGVDVAICPHQASIDRLTAGLKSSSLSEVLPLGGDAWIVEVEVTNESESLANFTLGQAEENIDGLSEGLHTVSKGSKRLLFQMNTPWLAQVTVWYSPPSVSTHSSAYPKRQGISSRPIQTCLGLRFLEPLNWADNWP